MAADAWLLEQAVAGEGPPVLRLYGWDEPSITIGYHQDFGRAVEIARLGQTPVVRRITGGRALLHDDREITYALAGNFIHHKELGESLQASYQRISEAIVAFYRTSGWDAMMSHRDAPVSLGGGGGVQKGCFAAVSHYEIIVNGLKMAAGSQRRAKNAMIQHGAIKIAPHTPHPAIVNMVQEIPGQDVKPLAGTRDELLMRLQSAFEQVFAATFAESAFTSLELSAIALKIKDFENLNRP